jgi:DnaJ-class molecular chaperone
MKVKRPEPGGRQLHFHEKVCSFCNGTGKVKRIRKEKGKLRETYRQCHRCFGVSIPLDTAS